MAPAVTDPVTLLIVAVILLVGLPVLFWIQYQVWKAGREFQQEIER